MLIYITVIRLKFVISYRKMKKMLNTGKYSSNIVNDSINAYNLIRNEMVAFGVNTRQQPLHS